MKLNPITSSIVISHRIGFRIIITGILTYVITRLSEAKTDYRAVTVASGIELRTIFALQNVNGYTFESCSNLLWFESKTLTGTG